MQGIGAGTLKKGRGNEMPRRKTVKELDTEIETLKRRVEIEELRGKLEQKKRRTR